MLVMKRQTAVWQGCGLGRDVSVSRRTNVSSRSRLGQNPYRLGLVSVSEQDVSVSAR